MSQGWQLQLGTDNSKYKLRVGAGKSKLRARDGKFKYGLGLVNTNWGQGK